MEKSQRIWLWGSLLFAALFINENTVQWMLAMKVGGFSLAEGFRDAFEYFTIPGFLFMTAFRLIPYICLGVVVETLSRSRFRDFCLPVLIGGMIGILSLMIPGLWSAQRPYYTDEHVSSTTAIAFVFIPIYAVLTGLIGALILASICGVGRYFLRKGK